MFLSLLTHFVHSIHSRFSFTANPRLLANRTDCKVIGSLCPGQFFGPYIVNLYTLSDFSVVPFSKNRTGKFGDEPVPQAIVSWHTLAVAMTEEPKGGRFPKGLRAKCGLTMPFGKKAQAVPTDRRDIPGVPPG